MKISNCCGANMNFLEYESDICPDCKEHCDIEENSCIYCGREGEKHLIRLAGVTEEEFVCDKCLKDKNK